MDLIGIIIAAGYAGLFAVVFAESGLFFGFFFPGDSLLFTAGLAASQGLFDIHILLAILPIAAVAGDSVGYWTGNKFGKRLFRKEDSLFFRKKHLLRAKEFYERHGGKTIVLARFVPIVRTFAPIVAGMGDMQYRRFLFYNVFGGLFWSFAMTLAGFYLGMAIPDIDAYILPIIVLIITISLLPLLVHVLRGRESRAAAVRILRKAVKRE